MAAAAAPREPAIQTNRRLHVLHVSGPTTGGVATVAASYVRDQVERGWNVTVACPSHGDLGYAAREAGATVRWWRAEPHDSTLPGAVARLNRIVRETRPDVVHLHSGKAGLAGRLVVRDRIPTVYQPHAWPFLAHRGGAQGASVRWERFAARWATELVCVSATERQLGESLGLHAPTAVIPNGIDLTVYRPADGRDRIHARKLLGLDDVPTLMCVGALTVQKGQQDLLADWPEVRERVPDALRVEPVPAERSHLGAVPGDPDGGGPPDIAELYAAWRGSVGRPADEGLVAAFRAVVARAENRGEA